MDPFGRGSLVVCLGRKGKKRGCGIRDSRSTPSKTDSLSRMLHTEESLETRQTNEAIFRRIRQGLDMSVTVAEVGAESPQLPQGSKAVSFRWANQIKMVSLYNPIRTKVRRWPKLCRIILVKIISAVPQTNQRYVGQDVLHSLYFVL